MGAWVPPPPGKVCTGVTIPPSAPGPPGGEGLCVQGLGRLEGPGDTCAVVQSLCRLPWKLFTGRGGSREAPPRVGAPLGRRGPGPSRGSESCGSGGRPRRPAGRRSRKVHAPEEPGPARRPRPRPPLGSAPSPCAIPAPRPLPASAKRWRCCPWNRRPRGGPILGPVPSRDRNPGGRTGTPAMRASQGKGGLWGPGDPSASRVSGRDRAAGVWAGGRGGVRVWGAGSGAGLGGSGRGV